MSQWISIKEALPEFDRAVLVTIDGKEPMVTIAYLMSVTKRASGDFLEWEDGSANDYNRVSDISYWMPLPTPATIPQP